jgi:competence protein ComEC
MQSFGAATFWMNAPARAWRAPEQLRLRQVPLVAAVLCFAAGDALALEWHPPLSIALGTLLLFGLTLFALRKAVRVAILPALAVWISAGCWCAQMQPPISTQQTLAGFADGLSRDVQGTVERVRNLPPLASKLSAPQEFQDDSWELDPEPTTQSLDIKVQAVEFVTPDISAMQRVDGGVRVLLTGAPVALHCGDLLTVPLRLRLPDDYRTPGAFSFAGELRSEGIGALASVPSSRIVITRALPRPSLRCRLFAAQTWAAGRLSSYVASAANHALPRAMQLTQKDATLLDAMLFGDRTRLTQALRLGFERTGTFHLFVVSGLHVALLAAVLFWLLRRLRLNEGAAVALTIAAATAYTLLTGFGVPAQRALLMTSVYLTARWLDRGIRPMNALAAAALVVLALDPRALFEASFQMTFLVVLAVAGVALPVVERWIRPHARALRQIDVVAIDAHMHPRIAQFRVRLRMACDLSEELLAPRLRHAPVWVMSVGYHLAEAALISIAAELCMVLPMAIYFHRATLFALPLNLVDIPLLGVLLCVAVVMFVCSLMHAWLAAIPAAFAALLLHLMRFTVDRVQHLRLADLRTPGPAPMAILLGCGLIAAACVALRSQRTWAFALGLAAALCVPVVVLWPAAPLLHTGDLEVTALDVGQGDSLLVVAPNGQTLLVDGGGPVGRGALQPVSGFDIGEEVVVPYLWSRRLRRLDAVLLTHAHSDHMGGLPAVLRDMRPSELWLSVQPGDAPGLRDLLAEARELGVNVRWMRAGYSFTWAGLPAHVLAPEAGYTNAGVPANDDSLVMRIDDGRASVLLEGDAEAPSEAAMLAHGRLAPATLLKVGHHGSRTSTNTAFLAAVAPHDAVISVGRHNTFGHPRAEVLARLEQAHVKTYRTDRMGTETFLLTSDGRISSQSTASK